MQNSCMKDSEACLHFLVLNTVCSWLSPPLKVIPESEFYIYGTLSQIFFCSTVRNADKSRLFQMTGAPSEGDCSII
jgi:hypothetical protein